MKPDVNLDRDISDLAQAVASGQRDAAVALTVSLLDAGVGADRILKEALICGINDVGNRFRDCECFVPEVLLAARAMKQCLAKLKPTLSTELMGRGTLVIGTVHGDLHDLGKNLVIYLVEAAGIRVIDLGVDVAPQRFADAVRQHRADIVGISALLTVTMRNVSDVIRALENAGVRNKVKVMVGGAPVTAEWAEQAGADGFAPDASGAAELCKRWLEER